MNRGTIISIILALLLVIAGGAAYLIFGTSGQNAAPPPKVEPLPSYVAQRSTEAPSSTHRALSMLTSEVPTAVTPWGIALDNQHGFVWIAEPGCEPKPKCSASQAALGQYALSDSSFIGNEYMPNGYSGPLFLALDGHGAIWFTEPNGDAIGEFDPQTASWHQWHLKGGSTPFDLVFDTHGNLWFTEFGTNEIGFFDPHTQKVVETPTPTAASAPYGITIDPQGTIWFAENALGVDQIGSFTPTPSGAIKITEYAVGDQRPHLITADHNGNIWYTSGFKGTIGEFNPRSGSNTVFAVFHGVCLTPPNCTGTHISGIFIDSKGNVWFTDSLSQRVGYLIPSTGQIVARTLNTSNAHPYDGLILDGNGRVWFTEEFRLTIVKWPMSSVN